MQLHTAILTVRNDTSGVWASDEPREPSAMEPLRFVDDEMTVTAGYGPLLGHPRTIGGRPEDAVRVAPVRTKALPAVASLGLLMGPAGMAIAQQAQQPQFTGD